jgi:hypothetical protein
MKKAILTSILAAASLAAAAPALAQGFASPPHVVSVRFAPDLDQRIAFLSGRVSQEQARGVIGWRAAQIMRAELGDVRHREQFDRFNNRGFLSGWQRMRLNESLDRVAAQLRF